MTVYKIIGDLGSSKVSKVKKEILELMKDTNTIILDLDDTKYMDSYGLGMLVAIYKESLSRNVDIRMKNINENIKNLLRITSLDELFKLDKPHIR